MRIKYRGKHINPRVGDIVRVDGCDYECKECLANKCIQCHFRGTFMCPYVECEGRVFVKRWTPKRKWRQKLFGLLKRFLKCVRQR